MKETTDGRPSRTARDVSAYAELENLDCVAVDNRTADAFRAIKDNVPFVRIRVAKHPYADAVDNRVTPSPVTEGHAKAVSGDVRHILGNYDRMTQKAVRLPCLKAVLPQETPLGIFHLANDRRGRGIHEPRDALPLPGGLCGRH